MGYNKYDYEQWKEDLKGIKREFTEWDLMNFTSDDEAKDYFLKNVVE